MSDATAPIPIERLLEHRAWVRTLARALVRDDSRADDIEQETWLAAMRSPPRHAGSLRGWLSQLVRHRAADLRRGESRRALRESEAIPLRETPEPVESVGTIEEHRRVVTSVLSLSEPYRSTVVLRFYDGLSLPQIAVRMDAPLETVRTRLRRALSQLREHLDAEHGGDGRAWAMALAPVADPMCGAPALLGKGGIIVAANTKAFLAQRDGANSFTFSAPRAPVGTRRTSSPSCTALVPSPSFRGAPGRATTRADRDQGRARVETDEPRR